MVCLERGGGGRREGPEGASIDTEGEPRAEPEAIAGAEGRRGGIGRTGRGGRGEIYIKVSV